MCECNNEVKCSLKPYVQCGNFITRINDISSVLKDNKIIHIFDNEGLEQTVTFKTKEACVEAFDFLARDLGAI